MRESPHDHQTHNYINCHQHHPPPPSSSTCAAPTPWLWLPLKTPLFPLVVSWPADGGLGVNTAEQQPDAGTECEGRRGRAPDLSEWGRPAREMYSLPLLYRNPSPYEYESIEHLNDMGLPDDALLERSSLPLTQQGGLQTLMRILRGTVDTFCSLCLGVSCGAFSKFHRFTRLF